MNIYSRKKPPEGFYVYFYLRSKDSKTAKKGTPYYVGKGSNDRAWESHGKTPIPKSKSDILIVESELSEIYAFILERYFIKWFGRKNINTGILLNKTDGGEGVCGIMQSYETIQKRIKANTGKTRSNQSKLNMSNSRKGIPSSVKKGDSRKQSTKEKISNKCVERVKNKSHNLIKQEDGSSVASNLSKKGKHNWQKTKNLVKCYDKYGNYYLITKDTYRSQSGDMESWEYVSVASNEGNRRKLIK